MEVDFAEGKIMMRTGRPGWSACMCRAQVHFPIESARPSFLHVILSPYIKSSVLDKIKEKENENQ